MPGASSPAPTCSARALRRHGAGRCRPRGCRTPRPPHGRRPRPPRPRRHRRHALWPRALSPRRPESPRHRHGPGCIEPTVTGSANANLSAFACARSTASSRSRSCSTASPAPARSRCGWAEAGRPGAAGCVGPHAVLVRFRARRRPGTAAWRLTACIRVLRNGTRPSPPAPGALPESPTPTGSSPGS